MYSLGVGQVVRVLFLNIFSILCMFFAICSCTRSYYKDIEFEELFQIPIGLSENRLYYSNTQDAQLHHSVQISMHNGIFSLSNSLTNKIVQYNSYGELLLSVYDPLRNAIPIYLNSNRNSNRISNRNAFPQQFQHIGELVVGEKGVLYVVDSVQPDQVVADRTQRTTLRDIVQRIDTKNNQQYYIGQEGVGGRPFPSIHGLFVSDAQQLIVICDSGDYWQIFWYSSDGKPQYTIEVDHDSLPALIDRADTIEIENIIPDARYDRLYMKLNYYRYRQNNASDTQEMPVEIISRVYWLDLPSGIYQGYIDVPLEYTRQDSQRFGEGKGMNFIPQLIGLTQEQYFVFTTLLGNEKMGIMVIDTKNVVKLRRQVAINDKYLLFSDFHISKEGIISTLFGYRDRIRVYWWRLDKILSGLKL